MLNILLYGVNSLMPSLFTQHPFEQNVVPHYHYYIIFVTTQNYHKIIFTIFSGYTDSPGGRRILSLITLF